MFLAVVVVAALLAGLLAVQPGTIQITSSKKCLYCALMVVGLPQDTTASVSGAWKIMSQGNTLSMENIVNTVSGHGSNYVHLLYDCLVYCLHTCNVYHRKP